VLGIALGFGAQNLVQDFLAGIFILLEDQYGVGDVIDVETITGTVEAVSLRITRVRDVNGIVWHIRNGTIEQAGNETHGWARAVVDFPVPYGTSVAAARGALERAAVDMSREPRWQGAILERPEVWGIETVSPDTLLVRVTARTAPLAKPEVTRELRERLKNALDAEQAAAGALASAAVPRQPGAAEPPAAGPASTGPASTGPASTGPPNAGPPADAAPGSTEPSPA
jgi:moderate conductance mechanosensitive channel